MIFTELVVNEVRDVVTSELDGDEEVDSEDVEVGVSVVEVEVVVGVVDTELRVDSEVEVVSELVVIGVLVVADDEGVVVIFVVIGRLEVGVVVTSAGFAG